MVFVTDCISSNWTIAFAVRYINSNCIGCCLPCIAVRLFFFFWSVHLDWFNIYERSHSASSQCHSNEWPYACCCRSLIIILLTVCISYSHPLSERISYTNALRSHSASHRSMPCHLSAICSPQYAEVKQKNVSSYHSIDDVLLAKPKTWKWRCRNFFKSENFIKRKGRHTRRRAKNIYPLNYTVMWPTSSLYWVKNLLKRKNKKCLQNISMVDFKYTIVIVIPSLKQQQMFPKIDQKEKKNHRTIACIAYMLMNGWEPRWCAATCSAQMD